MKRLTKSLLSTVKVVLRLHSESNLPSESGWLVPGIVPHNGLVVLASAPKTGKTVFTNALARAIASGTEFAGITWPQKMPVAWCSHEETPEERAPLLEGLSPDDPFYLSFPPLLPFLDDLNCEYERDRHGRYVPNAVPYVYEQARSLGVKLLVVDCLHAAVRHSNLAENQAARRIMGKLRHWSNEFGIATVVLHHLTKSAHRGYHPERFADSAQILASASCYFFMESHARDDGLRTVILQGAGRQPAPPRRQEFVAHNLFEYQYVWAGESFREATVPEKVQALLEEGWELTSEEIARRLGLGLQSVRNVLRGIPGVEKVLASSRMPRYRFRLESEETEVSEE